MYKFFLIILKLIYAFFNQQRVIQQFFFILKIESLNERRLNVLTLCLFDE